MADNLNITIEQCDDARKIPKRIAYVKKHTSIAVERERDDSVMTFPNLIIREILTFEIMMIVLGLWSLFIDAPLEEIATHDHSPNPAKAPWYFLGLQELLHYFPPLVAGVILPGLVIVSLVVIPYFNINWKRDSLWTGNIRQKFWRLSVVFLIFNIPFVVYHCAPIYISSIIIYIFMTIPLVTKKERGFFWKLKRLPLADWIMIWFIMVSSVLIIIGVFFRGPEWRWTWPWIDGIYY